ncbi:MAG: ribosome biogenesis GTP-binding protein YihA/YsxC [Saprospiraceae bacterium]
MVIKYADYIGSYPQYTLCPKDLKAEFAFIGRSNVGKSSLINMLLERKGLARISGKPGKTQMLNYYMVNGAWYTVDLPGYGYARISKRERGKWEKMINAYLTHRQTLVCAFVLIDCNIPPQEIDIAFINDLGKMRVPFAIVFTKFDKSKKPEIAEANIEKFKERLLEDWDGFPEYFVTSATKREGREGVLKYIQTLTDEYEAFKEKMS